MPPGFWSATLISIVLVSWLFYRFLAPKGWREWTSAGILQAFVIAFYAEMYGFPVTLYLLSRLLGVDASGDVWDSNLWIHLSGTSAVMVVSMAIGWTIAFFGMLLLISGWRAVYRAHQDRRMVTDGPYGLVRHPQYLGILMILFGEGVVHWPTAFSLAAFPVIAIAYVLLAQKEERQMIERFGQPYRDYQRRVPMLLPRRGTWRSIPQVARPAGSD